MKKTVSSVVIVLSREEPKGTYRTYSYIVNSSFIIGPIEKDKKRKGWRERRHILRALPTFFFSLSPPPFPPSFSGLRRIVEGENLISDLIVVELVA